MASLNGVVQRGAVKLDRPVNFKLSSFKSWLPHSQSLGSALRYLAPQLPRTTELAYVGDDTKILVVDHNIKLSVFISKLSSLCDTSNDVVCFKYQLPGKDLDVLIYVTNDEDRDHMMVEYGRLYSASAKPTRLQLFLFPLDSNTSSSFGSS
ncbi:hypothetical protein PS2_024450 [Malus domestica]